VRAATRCCPPLSRGPIPFDTILKYAAEIAQALDAAHRRGIVHRDLKPGNVMLTKSGTKLLDFGLAKLAAEAKALADSAMPLARPCAAHEPGRTAWHLALHVARAARRRRVDTRSDIHAFGALLFEMLSGRRVYEGPESGRDHRGHHRQRSAAAAAARRHQNTLPVVAHRALDRLLTNVLRKIQTTAGSLRPILRRAPVDRRRARPRGAGASAGAPAAGAARTPYRVFASVIWMAVAAIAIVALAGLAYSWYPRPAPPPAPVAFSLEAPDGHLLATGPGLLSVSPDGQRIAFVTDQGINALWIRTLGSLN
jgi:serine/threonine protein kinase